MSPKKLAIWADSIGGTLSVIDVVHVSIVGRIASLICADQICDRHKSVG
jgi:hypothetical protein